MRILALGDSFTQGYLVECNNYTRFLTKAGFEVINFGINGSTSSDMVKRYEKIKNKYKNVDYLIIFGGSNDFLNGQSVNLAYSNVKSILNLSTARKNIIIIPPLIEEEDSYPIYGYVNEKINEFAKKLLDFDCLKVDSRKIKPYYLDGLHMGKIFHEKLACEILKIIEDDINEWIRRYWKYW